MPHGTPDWGLVGPKSTTYGLDDLGEHAVRLGSPHLFDRRGDVLLLEDFRNGLGPLRSYANGLGGYVALSTGHTRQGAYSVKLVAGRTLTREASLIAEIAYPGFSRLGLEFTFSLDDDTDYMTGELQWDDGTALWSAGVRYDLDNTQLEVNDLTVGWTPFATAITLAHLTQPSHTLKFVANMLPNAAGQILYERCILNDLLYDLTPYQVLTGASVDAVTLRAYVEHYAAVGDNPVAYVDNVIVTQNEP